MRLNVGRTSYGNLQRNNIFNNYSCSNSMPSSTTVTVTAAITLLSLFVLICPTSGGSSLSAPAAAAAGAVQQPTRTRDTGIPQEYCEWERFQPNCSRGEVVVMKSAIYGRMRIGRCVGDGLGHLGCSTDVLRLADAKCSGRQTCDVNIPDKDFDATRPCYKEVKAYLEASYICMRVADAERGCTIQMSVIATVGSTINIASTSGKDAASGSGVSAICGTVSQPWVIQAEPGQRFNITMIDFGTAAASASLSDHASSPGASTDQTNTKQEPEGCNKNYGVIIDRTDVISNQLPTTSSAIKRNVTLCGGGRLRERDVFQTESHVVHLVTSPHVGEHAGSDKSREEENYFIVRLEAVGCADLSSPRDSWLKRTTNELVVGCLMTSQTWHLKCVGRRWVGVIGNCTLHIASAKKEALVHTFDDSLPHLLTIATVVGIALTLSFLIVCVGVFCYRKYAREERAKKQRYAVIASEKLYSDVMSGLEDGSMIAPYGKAYAVSGNLQNAALGDYPPHVWQLPLPPPGDETFLTSTGTVPHRTVHTQHSKPESDYSVGSVDSRYFVLDHGQSATAAAAAAASAGNLTVTASYHENH